MLYFPVYSEINEIWIKNWDNTTVNLPVQKVAVWSLKLKTKALHIFMWLNEDDLFIRFSFFLLTIIIKGNVLMTKHLLLGGQVDGAYYRLP